MLEHPLDDEARRNDALVFADLQPEQVLLVLARQLAHARQVMLRVLDALDPVARVHEARKRALDTRHLVGRVVVIPVRLGILQHADQVQRNVLGQALARIEVVIVVLV